MPEDRTLCSHVGSKNKLYLHWAVLLLSTPTHCLLLDLGHLAKGLRLAKKGL